MSSPSSPQGSEHGAAKPTPYKNPAWLNMFGCGMMLVGVLFLGLFALMLIAIL